MAATTDLKSNLIPAELFLSANFIPGAFYKKLYHSKPHSLRTLTVRLMTLCWHYHIKFEWIIILTPHDLQPTFEHVVSCMIPACRDTTSSAPLLSQVNQQHHLNPECYDAVILLTGESTLSGLFLVFGLVWTLLFVWEHVVLFSSCFFLTDVAQGLDDLNALSEKRDTSWVG